MKRNKKNKKQIIRKLLNKYRWLRVYDRNGHYYRDVAWLYNDYPKGWAKALLPLMIQDIHKELCYTGDVGRFRILDCKEKYGEMRCDHNGQCSYKVDEIIMKYAYLSHYTCTICGRSGMMVNSGWIIPMCKSCFDKRGYKKPYEEMTDPDDYFEPVFEVKIYNKSGVETREYDVTDIVKRMKPKYRQEINL